MDKLTGALTLLALASVLAAGGGKAAMASERDCLVGVYYFAGWWKDSPNKWENAGHDWRLDYPERIPILGQYNEQKTMDREIIAASSRGVDFFQILWYPNGGPLNQGLRTFMASPHASRMKFAIEYVNHPPFDLASDAEWESACREWCAAMKHPSYLRVGGRPVFKVHGAHFFLQQNGGDVSRAEARFETLRRIAGESGLPRPLIGGGVMAGRVPTDSAVKPYDYLTTYMDMPGVPKKDAPYPYEDLIGMAERAWSEYAETSVKPYVPYVPSGWDPRPWKDPRPSFERPTREQWTSVLKKVKSALDKYPGLGFPTGNRRQKAFLIYAWNEFAEGGIVAPTRGEGDMKLEAILEVFGPRL